MDDDDIGCFDEGSDIDNWEAKQVFQDECAERRGDFDEDEDDAQEYEDEFDGADIPEEST